MDLLTKYRPVRTLEFYQKKVLRFIHNSEGADDLRTVDIPYGPLGFDSPLHFIRCIPSELCEEYANDKLFQRIEKGLRKGYKVFITYDDGRIQSAVYRGQKIGKTGELGAMLDGFRNPVPIDTIVPYKEFLRKNVGAMLVDGPHRVTGTSVTYEEPKWEVNDALYYKPAKRWAVIEEREIYKNGKVYCKIKLEKSKTKREKLLWVGLWELMSDAIPYRVPIIPQNNANSEAQKRQADLDRISNEHFGVKQNLIDASKDLKIDVPDPKKFNRQVSNESTDSKTLNRQVSKESAESVYSKDMVVIHTATTKPSAAKREPPKRLNSQISQSSDTEIVNLKQSPKSPRAHNDYTEAPTITMRPKSQKPSMRPLTEFFHSQSEEIKDYKPLDNNTSKFKSASNLLAGQNSEDEEFTFEQYSQSLRRSARNLLSRQDNLLSRQVAEEAKRRTLEKSSKHASMSSDYLNEIPKQEPQPMDHRSMTMLNTQYFKKDVSSTNVTSTSDSDSTDAPAPPLPQSVPPPRSPENQSGTFIQNTIVQNPILQRTPSIVEKYFVEPTSSPSISRNFENANFHNPNPHGSMSLSSNSNSVQDGIYSMSDIADAVAQDSDASNHIQYQNPNLHHAYSVPVFDQKTEFLEKYIDIKDYLYSGTKVESDTNSMKSQKSSRYAKNPSVSRSQHGEHFQKGRSVPNILAAEEQERFPLPFNSENIVSAVGKGRGIQAGYHSCYADVSLFSLFYCTNIFDRILLEELETDKGMKRDVKRILRQKIVKPVRLSAFCTRESVSHLREAMLPLSSKLSSSFMDAEEFLYLLFENALNLPEFLKYSNGTNDFMHQIIIRPKDRTRCHDVQFLFETSLEINNLKLQDVPMPALMLCMPRCNGRLVYYEAIIPNLSLNITTLINKGPKKCICDMAASLECALCYKQYGDVSLAYCQTCQKMADQIHYHIGHNPVLIPKPQKNITLNLLSVICIRANHYTCFVKTGQDRFAPWLFFEASATEHPQVILLDDFGRWLDKLEREPGRYREFAKMHPYLKRLITESHISIYFSPDAVPESQFSESFMI